MLAALLEPQSFRNWFSLPRSYFLYVPFIFIFKMWPLWLILPSAVFQPFIRCSLQCRDLVDEAKKFHLRPELRSQMQGPRTRARLGKLASWQKEGIFFNSPLPGGMM